MHYFLADYIHPQKLMGFTSDIEKVNSNLNLIKPFADNIAAKKQAGEGKPFTLMTVCGRWIVVYSTNGLNEEDTTLYFTDFRVELDNSLISNYVSTNAISNMKVLQFRYDGVYEDAMDIYDLTYWQTGEKVLKGNLVACDVDVQVLGKAKDLGALPMIQTLNPPDKIKMTLVDEKIKDGNSLMVNAYALIHFGATPTESNGFAYLKLYDLLNNFDLIDEFVKTLESLGVKFNRAILMEKFTPERLN